MNPLFRGRPPLMLSSVYAPLAGGILSRSRIGFARALTLALIAISAFPMGFAVAATPPSNSAASAPFQAESTRRMAARLRELATAGDPFGSPYRFTERVALLRSKLKLTADPVQAGQLKVQIAHNLLSGGESEAALNEFIAAEQFLRETNQPFPPALTVMFLTAKAVCYLRIGEQENCLNNHNADSCLFPIRGGGIHQNPRGSHGAIGELTTLLKKYPGDLRARWLLNIAFMTLGEYPDKVPSAWLIDPKVFASDYDIKRFPDIAGQLGLAVDDLAGGVVMDDFDHDGFLDLMVSAQGTSSQLRFYRNQGDGTFSDRTEPAGLTGEVGGLNLVSADYNNDGFIDVLVLRGGWLGIHAHHPNSLLRNNGDGTFTDTTEEAGLLSFHPKQTAVWFDYDGDGRLDLFIGNESTPGDPNPCELFRNNGNGTFTECARDNGLAFVGYVKGVVSGDFNNDGRPDLYISRQDGANLLYRNDGPVATGSGSSPHWKFTEVAAAAGVTEPFSSFSCWFWDYDNDGWLDLFVAGYNIQDVGDIAADYLGLPHAGERARLYRNNRDGTFSDVTHEAGLFKMLHTMGCNFGDLDNDGWLDFYVGTGNPELATLIPNRMFRNDGGKKFQDVTTSGGFGQLQKGHGVAFGDLDNDGDQDIYSVLGGAISGDHYPSQLFENPGHGNHWIKLELEGVKSNRAAVGARLKVVVRNSDHGEREIHRVIGSGGSFGAGPMMQEIGLGQAQAIERVEIFWPVTGQTQVLKGLAIDHRYAVRENDPVAREVPVHRFSWAAPSGASAPHHHHGSPQP